MAIEDYERLAQTLNRAGTTAGSTGVATNAPLRLGALGRQSAFQNLAMSRLGRRGKQSQMMDRYAQDQLDVAKKQAEPDIFDILGLGVGGVGAVKGLEFRDKMRDFYGY